MQRLKGLFQLFLAGLCLLIVLGTAINLGNILLRPESVSVVNALVGQSVLIICFLALSRILQKKGMASLRAASAAGAESDNGG